MNEDQKASIPALAQSGHHDLDKAAEEGEKGSAPSTILTASSLPPNLSRSLQFRIDALLMPLLTIAFGLQFYDKAVLGSALLFGIQTDLQLAVPLANGKTDLTRYSTATACFYYGYLVGAGIMALLVQRLPTSKFLGSMVILWGVIVILTPVITSFRGLYAQRIFLGLIESAVSPGFVHVTRKWYSRSQQPVRLGVWYSATGLFSIASGLINYGLGRASQGSAIAAWKSMFLFAGGITIVFGMVLLLILPPAPLTPALLSIPGLNRFSAEEGRAITERVQADGAHEESTEWSTSHVWEAARDPKIYLFFLMAISIYICNGGVTAFGSLIIRSFGYTPLRSLLLQTPGGATTCVSIYLTTYLARRIRNTRLILLSFSCVPVLIGAALLWRGSWTNRALPLAAYYLLPIFGAPFVLLLSVATANISGSTKHTCAAAAIFAGYCVGNILAPYTVRAQEASSHYRSTFISIISCMCTTILLAGILGGVMWRENRVRERRCAGGAKGGEEVPRVGAEREGKKDTSGGDLTDWQDWKRFRYVF